MVGVGIGFGIWDKGWGRGRGRILGSRSVSGSGLRFESGFNFGFRSSYMIKVRVGFRRLRLDFKL